MSNTPFLFCSFRSFVDRSGPASAVLLVAALEGGDEAAAEDECDDDDAMETADNDACGTVARGAGWDSRWARGGWLMGALARCWDSAGAEDAARRDTVMGERREERRGAVDRCGVEVRQRGPR